MKYQIINQQRMFQGFFAMDKVELQFERFQGGMMPIQTRELFERGHAAAVLPYDAKRDEVVWIEQFRLGALQAKEHPWIIEAIAGVFDADENAEQLVKREAIEEAGCDVFNLEKISEYMVSPGGTSEKISLYCGQADTSLVGGFHGLAEEGEDIKVHVLSFDESVGWLEKGKLNSATPIIAMQWLIQNRQRLRQTWQ